MALYEVTQYKPSYVKYHIYHNSMIAYGIDVVAVWCSSLWLPKVIQLLPFVVAVTDTLLLLSTGKTITLNRGWH